MKLKISTLLVGMVLLAFGSTWMFAQSSSDDTKSKSDTRTITGCLSKGDSSNEFLLTATDGSTWEIRSDSASLADHVGQTVTATGVVKNATAHNLKEDAKDAAEDAHMKKSSNEHGHMTVTDVQKVSDSCSK
jgi:hypothetical protein